MLDFFEHLCYNVSNERSDERMIDMAAKADKKKTTEAASGRSERQKALDMAMAQIEKQYGKGSIMRLGENTKMNVEAVPTGSIALDAALGIGGQPRGRIIEIYRPEA